MYRRVFLGLALGAIVLGVSTTLRPREPDPDLVRLAVRATMYAMPTATPVVIEVTRIVEVVATPTPLPTSTPAPIETPTPTEIAQAQELEAEPMVQAASLSAEAVHVDAAITEPAADEASSDDASSVDAVADGIAAADYTVADVQPASGCPVTSDRSFALIPITGATIDHPDSLHGDLNLSLRGYYAVGASASLVSINGPAGDDPPQLAGVLPGNASQIIGTYQVGQWDWGCGQDGCRGSGGVPMEVSLLGLATSPGMPVSVPTRGAEIYGGGFVALVVYAEETRLTVVYTREDSVANGYAVHIENFCVDPALLSAYRAANAAGRGNLPAVHNGEVVGVASGNEVLVAIRDRGAFQDPRSQKDWWR